LKHRAGALHYVNFQFLNKKTIWARAAIGIFNIQYVIDSEKILIGGVIIKHNDLIDRINTKLQEMRKDINISVERENVQFYYFMQRKSPL
jgi:hypothetical protein